jgi:hypothetical protein
MFTPQCEADLDFRGRCSQWKTSSIELTRSEAGVPPVSSNACIERCLMNDCASKADSPGTSVSMKSSVILIAACATTTSSAVLRAID